MTSTRPVVLPATLRTPPHRPVLRIGPGARLLGLDGAIVVENLEPPLARMLDDLAEPAGTTTLLARVGAAGGDPLAARELLTELVDHGALVDADAQRLATRRRAAATVVVLGAGPLSTGIVLGLGHAGVGTIHTTNSGTVRTADLGTGLVDEDLGKPRLAATVDALRKLCPDARTGPPPLRGEPELVVFADTPPGDPELLQELHTDGTPHLLARLLAGVGVVGPLVLPGRTACLTCIDRYRAGQDPRWPEVARQLEVLSGEGEQPAVAATVALTTAQALAAIDGLQAPAVLESALEVNPTAGTIVTRAWTPWPGCPCGAG